MNTMQKIIFSVLFLLGIGCIYNKKYLNIMRPRPRTSSTINEIKELDLNKTEKNTRKDHETHKEEIIRIKDEQFLLRSAEAKERLERRRSHVQEICDNPKYSSMENVSYTINERYFIFHDYNVSLCRMFKVGSSSWREHLRELNGGPSQAHLIHEDTRLVAFLNRTEDQVFEDIDSHVKILTVRHPLIRLVSSFTNIYKGIKGIATLRPYNGEKKINEKRKDAFKLTWKFKVMKYWIPVLACNNLLPTDLHLQLGIKYPFNPNTEYDLRVYIEIQKLLKPTITFSDFLRHVVKTFEAEYKSIYIYNFRNEYWQECSPCSLRYNYITKLETMTEDLEYIFTQNGMPLDPKRQINITNKKKDPYAYLSDYAQVPLLLRQEIYRIYRKDMDMFGYDLPNWFLT